MVKLEGRRGSRSAVRGLIKLNLNVANITHKPSVKAGHIRRGVQYEISLEIRKFVGFV